MVSIGESRWNQYNRPYASTYVCLAAGWMKKMKRGVGRESKKRECSKLKQNKKINVEFV